MFACAVMADTYYIDFDSGDDTNTGTAKTSPWKTIPGTRNSEDSDWLRLTWGPAATPVFTQAEKVPPDTQFIIKRGTIYDQSAGGIIWINKIYYTNGSFSSPITFTVDPEWGEGQVVFDGTGMHVGIALILIQTDGVFFDGGLPYGISIENSPKSGIQVKEKSGNSDPTNETSFRNIRFFNNGTLCITGDECSVGQLDIRKGIGLRIEQCKFDGNQNHLMGLQIADDNKYVQDASVTNCISHSHVGDDPPNDAGIGFKAFNSTVTFENCESYNNLKGWDLGENDNQGEHVINYKLINCKAYNNSWGVNFNSSLNPEHSGLVNFYLINSIIQGNYFFGSNTYSGPYNLYIIHNTFIRNGSPDKIWGNLRISSGNTDDETEIHAYLYNNVFYKPEGKVNLNVSYIGDGSPGRDTYFNLHADYNSWIQRADEKVFVWSAYRAENMSPALDFYYGSDGPGYASGKWYTDEDEPGNGTGHQGCDAHSRSTGGRDSSPPPFADKAADDFTLTNRYAGKDLSAEPWYIPAMGIDRAGNPRTHWDMGAYEFVSLPPAPYAPTNLKVVP